MSRLRHELSAHLKWGRMVEPIVLTVLYITVCMVLPLFFPCTPTECLEENGVLYCATGEELYCVAGRELYCATGELAVLCNRYHVKKH